MIWIALLPKEISTPGLTFGKGIAVNTDINVSNFLEPHLIPFFNKYYLQRGHIFRPDKASSHYSRMTTDFLDTKAVSYDRKEDNPTKVSQFMPVEDFFGLLAIRVYGLNWAVKNTEALKRRI